MSCLEVILYLKERERETESGTEREMTLMIKPDNDLDYDLDFDLENDPETDIHFISYLELRVLQPLNYGFKPFIQPPKHGFEHV